jgi:hypothetical protein
MLLVVFLVNTMHKTLDIILEEEKIHTYCAMLEICSESLDEIISSKTF